MKFTKSIRWRLLLWIACILTLILAGLDFTVYQIHFSNGVNRLDEELRSRVAVLSASLFAPGGPSGDEGPPPHHSAPPGQPGQPGDRPPWGDHPPDNFNAPPDMPPDMSPDAPQGPPPDGPRGKPFLDATQTTAAIKKLGQFGLEGFYFVIWTGPAREPVQQSTNCPGKIPRPQLATHDTATYTRTRGALREMFHATERGDCLLVGQTLAPEISDARRFAGWLACGSAAMLAFSLGGAWLIIGRALRPVEKISDAARRIAGGNLSERINGDETDSELGQLVAVLNSTFARLETAFVQQKQFTADAAHELRTPIAVLISEAQTTLARERGPADYRESVAVCLDTAQQMRRLTDSLLELTRLDAGQETLRRDKLNLEAVVQDCVKRIHPLALEHHLQIHCDLAPVETFGDALRLSQVVTNLLANAVRYNRDPGEISVVTRAEGGCAVLAVSDTGVGISAADLPRIFERFYRADKSRTGTGNSGLGLAICKAVVEAHGGTIEVASQAGQGSTFTVRLPATPAPTAT